MGYSIVKGSRTIDKTSRQMRLAGRMSMKSAPCWYIVPDEFIAANPGIAGLLASMLQNFDYSFNYEQAQARKKELEDTQGPPT